jgi:lysophospholipase L1-like esterase
VDSRDALKTERFIPANLGKNLLLIFLSLILALAVVEGALRIYNPLGFRIKGNKIILPIHKDEVIHYDRSPRLDKIVRIHRNSLGFKGEEPPVDFAERLTILAVGGSTTEGVGLNDAKTWPLVLEAKLKRNFSKVWLNNAGLSGHSTFGHLILMQDYIRQINPKVVLFLIGLNDLGIEAVNDFDGRMTRGLSYRSLDAFLGGLAIHSEVAAAVLNLKRYYFPKVVPQVGKEEVNFQNVPRLEVAAEDKAAIKRIYRDKYLGPYELRLQNLLEMALNQGIVPVLITQPVLYGNLADPRTGVDLGKMQVTRDMNGGLAWEVLELYNDITRKVGKDKGAPVIDLAGKMPKNSVYYFDLTHFTNEGAEKAAGIVYEELRPYLARKFPGYASAAGGNESFNRKPKTEN